MRAAGEGLSRVVTPLPGAGDKDGTLSSKLLLFVKRGVCQIHFPAVALLHVRSVGCMLALCHPQGLWTGAGGSPMHEVIHGQLQVADCSAQGSCS